MTNENKTKETYIGADPSAEPGEIPEAEGDAAHQNHRRRQRRKAYPWPGALDATRQLELLLFETMPRCDTYDTAKELLERCGGVKNFVDGTPEALAAMEALGEHTAVYLEALSLLCRRYEDELLHGPREFPSLYAARQWLRYAAWPSSEPVITVLMLDSSLKVLLLKQYSAENTPLKSLAAELSGAVMTLLPSYLYFTFTHPKSFLAPTREEYDLLRSLSDACLHTKAYLAEAMVINGDGVRFLSASPLFPAGTFLPFPEES